MIKPCSVIYLPGAGGTFFRLCLSLSKETVPFYKSSLNDLTNEEIYLIRKMSAEQRKEFLRIKDFETFKNVHGSSIDSIISPDFYYSNPLINDYFEWVIAKNHTNNYQKRLPYLKKILYLEIDPDRYQTWTKNAYQYFNPLGHGNKFRCALYLEMQNIQEIKKNPITTTLCMNSILDSQLGFETQYLQACSALNITPELECAVDLYKDWRKFRVDPFLESGAPGRI